MRWRTMRFKVLPSIKPARPSANPSVHRW
jgi:hypothetical protein